MFIILTNSFSDSVNELLKIKDDLTKERDEKLSDIAKVRICPVFKLILCEFFLFYRAHLFKDNSFH